MRAAGAAAVSRRLSLAGGSAVSTLPPTAGCRQRQRP